MFADHNNLILEILETRAGLSADQQAVFREVAHETGLSAAQQALDAGLVRRQDLLRWVAEYLGHPFEPVVPGRIPESVASVLPANLARNYGVVPRAAPPGRLELLARDPFNHSVVDDLTFVLNRDIELVVCDPDLLDSLLLETYGEETTTFDSLLEELSDDAVAEVVTAGGEISDAELSNLANETPIIRFVNLIIQQAIQDKASDIHFEPYEDRFRIRYRIDGSLYEMAPPPLHLALPVISRLKVVANLNIAERRVPQDGRIKTTLAGRPVDLRVSTLPTRHGESVVLRVLDKSVVNLDLDALTMPPDVLQQVRAVVRRPNGIFLVTGPTGSGKTTTLYSALREINDIETKILTAEDPVEYEIEGIMQVAVNHQVGLSFARALRSFLRQDPDVILVGEIRDLETAQIAVQASLTGHLVLSTLHTNDAPGAVTRLVDMGLEPYLIAAALEAVLGQRLVRRIDPQNRVAYQPDPDLVRLLGLDPAQVAGRPFYFGRATPENNQTGYRGRIGLFEMLMIHDVLRELINNRAPSLVLRQRAVELGMRTLREDGIRAIFDGQTTLEEVLKYT